MSSCCFPTSLRTRFGATRAPWLAGRACYGWADVLVGAIVGASFVLLLLVCEALSGFLWQDADTEKYVYCRACDLRYVRDSLRELGGRVCREGHAIPAQRWFPWIPALITACVTFIAISLFRLGTGLGSP